MKSIIAVALTLSVSASLLAGCSKATSGGKDSKVTLELFSNKPESKATLQELIDEFQKANSNITIKLNAPAEAETVLRTRLTKSDMPDIMSIGGDALYGELSRAGVLTDFTGDAMVSEVQDAYITMSNKLVGDDDTKVYGIPYATNANGVLYNKDKFKELNLQIPKTWDEFIADADKIKAAGQTPFYFTLKDSWTDMIPWNALAANIAPEDFTAKREKNETKFKDAYGEVADNMLKLLNYGHSDNFGKGYNDGNAAFAQGKSVMYMQGNWAIPEILKANPNIKIGMFTFPATNDASKNKLVSGVDVMLTTYAKSKHKEEAKKFIQFMIEKENAQKYIKEQSALSAIKGVYQEDETVKDIASNFESGNITSFPDHYYPSGMETSNLIQEFLMKKDKAAFLDKLDAEWDKVKKTTK